MIGVSIRQNSGSKEADELFAIGTIGLSAAIDLVVGLTRYYMQRCSAAYELQYYDGSKFTHIYICHITRRCYHQGKFTPLSLLFVRHPKSAFCPTRSVRAWPVVDAYPLTFGCNVGLQW